MFFRQVVHNPLRALACPPRRNMLPACEPKPEINKTAAQSSAETYFADAKNTIAEVSAATIDKYEIAREECQADA